MAQQSAFLRVDEVAEMLDLTTMRVYQLIRAGEVPAVKVGNRLRIPRRAMELWLEQKTELALAAVGGGRD